VPLCILKVNALRAVVWQYVSAIELITSILSKSLF
jgi:hypothetical protein